MKKLPFRAFGLILMALCLTLVAGSCHRKIMVKYGGPPAGYKSMNDSKAHQQGVKNV